MQFDKLRLCFMLMHNQDHNKGIQEKRKSNALRAKLWNPRRNMTMLLLFVMECGCVCFFWCVCLFVCLCLCSLCVCVQRSCCCCCFLSDCCQQVRWAIGDGGLNISPEGLMITPPFHQRHLLWPPFSLRKVVLSRERLPP